MHKYNCIGDDWRSDSNSQSFENMSQDQKLSNLGLESKMDGVGVNQNRKNKKVSNRHKVKKGAGFPKEKRDIQKSLEKQIESRNPDSRYKEPGPSDYNIMEALKQIIHKNPSHVIQPRRGLVMENISKSKKGKISLTIFNFYKKVSPDQANTTLKDLVIR